MQQVKFIISMWLTFLLVACGSGHSGKNDDAETDVSETYSLTLSIDSEHCNNDCNHTFASDDTVVVTATLLLGSAPAAGEIINFTAGVGELSASQALTNSNGVATINLTNSSENLNAGILNASFDTLTTNQNYQFTAASDDDPDVSTPEVYSLSLTLDNPTCNSNCNHTFSSDDTVIVSATLLLNSAPAAGEIINFTAGVGEISANQILTNSNGVATINLTNSSENLNAGILNASFNGITTNQNYQFTAADGEPDVGTPDVYSLSLTLDNPTCNSNCNHSFSSDDTIVVTATLLLNSAPAAGEIINFTAGVGELSASQALTNNNGVATINLTNNTENLNAGILNASFDTLTTNQNYQFTAGNTQSATHVLSIDLTSPDCQLECASFTQNETVTITATLTDENNTPLTGQVVNFTAPLGQLNVNSKLTNNEGKASVSLSNSNGTLGASTISASHDALNANINYEFVLSTQNSTAEPQFALTLPSGIRIQVGQTTTLNAQVHDANGDVMVNQLVNFSLAQGILNTNSALTNAQGIAEVTYTPLDTDLGAFLATASTTINDVIYNTETLYEVLPENAVEANIEFGYFDGTTFIPNKIGIQGATRDESVNIAAGGTASLFVSLAELQTDGVTYLPYFNSAVINFSSICVQQTSATIDAAITTVAGRATSTFENTSCSSTVASTDTISASVTINNNLVTITRDINLLSTELGSLSFISANPTQLVMAESGGAGQSETATLTFQALDSQGNPIPQLDVNFSLTTSLGGLSIFPVTSVTNSQGLVTTQVSAGAIPTSVVVEASATLNNVEVKSQSSELTVSTGLPDQDSFVLVSDVTNSETFNYIDELVTLTAYLADTNESAAIDGTTVVFKAEGGALLQDRCSTINGSCSVTWRGGSPIPENHRVTILATAIGHESFADINSNGLYDETDGEPFDDGAGAGFLRQGNGIQDDAGKDYNDDGTVEPAYTDRNANGVFDGPGFIDLPEAWLDANEDGIKNSNEEYNDFNADNTFNLPNGLFNGPQCTDNTICQAAPNNRIELRASTVLISSSSFALYTLTRTDTGEVLADQDGVYINTISLAAGQSASFRLNFTDTGQQILPAGTTLTFSSNVGEISNTGRVIQNSSGAVDANLNWVGGNDTFVLTNNLTAEDTPSTGSLQINMTTPKGNEPIDLGIAVNLSN
ncbi:beta strand repeat-containing protein [Algibacillus agarilyticus]|uniref:beta strand repeat-containing protein n=1 Tax=Algibacillus agarilyticus TaxID=2234133 RepID=UPI000DCFD44F|nr:Ig-like domain-containing protein [Algibacillus agarilyticus]